ncbi:hypothetical protein LZG72_23345 [Dyadobacter sp. CY323]|nr:hypothetical protein [Dyadobacter sp. CY323]
MKVALTFPEEVAEWLVSAGYQCVIREFEVTFCSCIQIEKNGGILMQLALVSIHSWRQSGSFAELEICFQHVHEQRHAGNKCVLIWEDYWLRSKEIVKSRLHAMMGISQKIPGRLTLARRIDKEIAAAFLEKNHLNGSVNTKFRFGLFLPKRYFRVLDKDFELNMESEELLVAVAIFSYPRIFQKENKPFKSFELIRFGSLLQTNVVGGLDKLLHAFIHDREPDDIMTYADLDWSDGAGYAKLGFENRGLKPPQAFYLNPKTMSRLSKGVNAEKFPDETSIEIFNMGSIKYVGYQRF